LPCKPRHTSKRPFAYKKDILHRHSAVQRHPVSAFRSGVQPCRRHTSLRAVCRKEGFTAPPAPTKLATAAQRHPWRLFLPPGRQAEPFKSLIPLWHFFYQCHITRSLCLFGLREKGLEPLSLRHQILSLACLPIPPLSQRS
jgi:hypothetical protein